MHSWAIADYGEAITLNPKYGWAYVSRGSAKTDKGDYDGAIADYSEVIRMLSTDTCIPCAYNGRCYARVAAGKDLQAALADCNRAVALEPNDANMLDSRGFAYLKLGQFDNAIADYNAALRIDSKFTESLYGRGVAEIRKGESAAGNADIAAAKAIRANIADEMAKLGMSP